MELKDIKRMSRKTININLKITPETSEWLKKNKISPTRLWDKAVEELIEKQKSKRGK